MAWWYASRRGEEDELVPPASDPLGRWESTPSQRATLKYFWVVSALILVQMLLGIITAHYGVEGDGFYGFALSDWIPYSVSRTWHVQMGLFWIATAWLAAGLFIGPLVSEKEPKGQRLGVNILFAALLLVVVGSLTGEWLSIHNKMSDTVAFYFGHQGYEYVDLGRVWQLALFAGLLLWFFLMIRVLRPAMQKSGDQKQLVALLGVSTAAIALFYGAGLTWGSTHISRWSNIGGGGSSTCGLKDFLRYLQPPLLRLFSCDSTSLSQALLPLRHCCLLLFFLQAVSSELVITSIFLALPT